MGNLENELLLDAQHDAQVVEYIQSHLPIDLRDKYQEDDLYYCLDLIETYLVESGVLDNNADNEYVDIDLEQISTYIVSTAKKEDYAEFLEEDILFVVQNYFDYEEQFY